MCVCSCAQDAVHNSAMPRHLAARSFETAASHCESSDQSSAVTSAWHCPYVRWRCIGVMLFSNAGVLHTCMQAAVKKTLHAMSCLVRHTVFCDSTCTRRCTAQAMNWPSGLNFAAATGPLKLKWCSSTCLLRFMSSALPSVSTASSSTPSGLRQSVLSCPKLSNGNAEPADSFKSTCTSSEASVKHKVDRQYQTKRQQPLLVGSCFHRSTAGPSQL